MKKITVTTQILDENLGDGFDDNYKAACELAELYRATWESELAEYEKVGYEIDIDIDVEKNTGGCSRRMAVIVENDEDEDEDENFDKYEETRKIESLLSSENQMWEDFC